MGDVLLRVYAGCIDGEEELMNDGISSGIGAQLSSGARSGPEPDVSEAV